MSWAETKKINSDMSEPLNYSNYIYDISMFKENSYVLSKMNQSIWDDFCFNSSYLYGHAGIHNTVLNALSIENVNKLWEEDFNLGKKLNHFHATDSYTTGNATNVIPGITMKSYNLLEQKLREGYQRYIEKKLVSTECGAWLNTTFGFNSSALAAVTLIEDVINSDSLYAMVLTNEAAIVAITSSKTIVDIIASSSNAITLIMNNLTTFIENEVVVNAIINNASLMEIIFSDITALTVISNNSNTVKAITYSAVAFEKLLLNETAVNIFTSNEISNEQLGLSFMDYANSEYILNEYKENYNNILKLFPNLIGSNAVLSNLVTLQTYTESMIAELSSLDRFADIIAINYNAMIENVPIVTVIFHNETSRNSIINSKAAMTVISNSEAVMTFLCNNKIAMRSVLESSVARNCFFDSPLARSIISTSTSTIALMKTITTQYVANTSIASSGATSAKDVIYDGKAFVFSIKNGYYNNTATARHHGIYVDGAPIINESIVRDIAHPINKFASSVRAGGSSALTLSAEYFKI